MKDVVAVGVGHGVADLEEEIHLGREAIEMLRWPAQIARRRVEAVQKIEVFHGEPRDFWRRLADLDPPRRVNGDDVGMAQGDKAGEFIAELIKLRAGLGRAGAKQLRTDELHGGGARNGRAALRLLLHDLLRAINDTKPALAEFVFQDEIAAPKAIWKIVNHGREVQDVAQVFAQGGVGQTREALVLAGSGQVVKLVQVRLGDDLLFGIGEFHRRFRWFAGG